MRKFNYTGAEGVIHSMGFLTARLNASEALQGNERSEPSAFRWKRHTR